jgi:hypothetical protein
MEVFGTIDDLSRVLQAMLTERSPVAVEARGELPPELAEAQVVFDHPDKLPPKEKTTVDLFLYDIRESLELRSNEPFVERKNGKVITHPPPVRVACSYLVTAWPIGGAELALQEHRLLSRVLQIFSRFPTIPDEFLQRRLKPPVPLVTAVVDPQKNLSEFWTALGSRMRPSLTVTATISMELFEPEKAAPVISEDLRIGQRTAPDEEEIIPSSVERIGRIGVRGRITDTENKPVAGASVTLPELGLSATTDSEGQYRLIFKESGTYILRVQKGNRVKELKMEAKPGAENDLELQ